MPLKYIHISSVLLNLVLPCLIEDAAYSCHRRALQRKECFRCLPEHQGGIRYLRWLLSYYRGNVELAAAAYNAGEKAVDRYFGIPPYPETREYVKRLKKLYQRSTHSYDETITEPSPIVMERGNSRK